MKCSFAFIWVSVIMLSSCEELKIDYEVEVYNEIIEEIIDFRHYYQPAPSPVTLNDSQSEEKKQKNISEYNTRLHQFQQRYDTITKFIYVANNLEMVDVNEFHSILGERSDFDFLNKDILEEKEFRISNRITDDSLRKLSIIMSDSSSEYEILNSIGFREDGLHLGYLVLSRILFNNDNTKGALIYSFLCGTKCGEKSLLIIEKANEDNWDIIEKVDLSVY